MRVLPFLILPLGLALPLMAADVQPVANFDGIYGGTIRANMDVPKPACGESQAIAVTVKNGIFDTDSTKNPAVRGNVNVKGFITGQLRRPDGRQLPIEGRAETIDGVMTLSAGAVDDALGCKWAMDLKKAS